MRSKLACVCSWLLGWVSCCAVLGQSALGQPAAQTAAVLRDTGDPTSDDQPNDQSANDQIPHSQILDNQILDNQTLDNQMPDNQNTERSRVNLPTPTMGGKQFWTDFEWRGGWRIQQNVMTRHWRLLDANNVRRAWGSRAACESELNLRHPDRSLSTPNVILLMHGLGRSSSSMQGLARYLHDHGFGTAICLEYASSRDSIAQHAAALREVVAGLPADVHLNFIGHSMGNIVVRHALGDWQQARDAPILNRIQHVVMLGPPNQGASIARQLARTGVLGWVAGQGAMELGKNWGDLETKLATPACPFGIIAGRLSARSLSNPLVDGAGDFVVSVEETKLPGAADFLEVPVMHSFLMDSTEVQQAVACFLTSGKFKEP